MAISQGAIGVLLLAASGLAVAQAGPKLSLEQRFQRLDADGDGAVTWREAYTRRVQEFAGMDRNRDGLVVPAEFGGRARPFTAFDVDGDGRLQLAEYIGQHHSMFSRFDRQGDGRLDLEEFEQAQRTVRQGGDSGRG